MVLARLLGAVARSGLAVLVLALAGAAEADTHALIPQAQRLFTVPDRMRLAGAVAHVPVAVVPLVCLAGCCGSGWRLAMRLWLVMWLWLRILRL